MTMNNFIAAMTKRAKQVPKRVAFPESANVDILKTAEQTAAMGIGFPLLLGSQETIERLAAEQGVSTKGFTYFDYTKEDNRLALAKEYTEKFDDFSAKAVARKAKDAVRCAFFLLKLNKADCAAAGKEYATGEVIFEAMSILGLQDGVESVSSLGIAEIPDFKGGQDGMLGLADCAITAQPDAGDLAGIAISSANTVRKLLGWEPRVAMLSFSTCGSAEHESLEVVREAVARVRQLRPDILVDGEFQLDAAIIPEVAAHKVKWESPVAGKANILVFPNLHAGNIGVKMIQLFGRANAYGPVLQGFAWPVCDFSRSAPVAEMLGNVAMLVIRAAADRS